MTAEEFLKENYKLKVGVTIEDVMIEFAKYHVQKALEEASKSIEQTKLDWEDFHDFSKGVTTIDNIENIQAILEAYPLENIK